MSNQLALIGAITAMSGMNVRSVEGTDAFVVTATDFGNVDMVVANSGGILRVSSDLISGSDVDDVNSFNKDVLAMNSEGPLGLGSIGYRREDDMYEVYGVLSADSKPEVIEQELTNLAQTVVALGASLSLETAS